MTRIKRDFNPKRVTFNHTPDYCQDFSQQKKVVPKPFFRACDRYDMQTMNGNGKPLK